MFFRLSRNSKAFNVHTDLTLVLNAHQTKFMLFSRSSTGNGNLYISAIEGFKIEKVQESKYLGIWIDENLHFKHLIDNLVTTLQQNIGFLGRNRATSPCRVGRGLMKQSFLSVFSVCFRLW